MMEIRRSAISLDEKDLIEMERILLDSDEKGALVFLKKAVHDQLLHAQQGRLKSHLDRTNPVEDFAKNNQ